jgi:hypothetical protein
MDNLDWAIVAPLERKRRPADSQITQRRSSRPCTTLLPWSPWTGTRKSHRQRRLVLCKTLPKVASEMALHVLAYNLTRVTNIIGVKPLMAAIGA